MDQSLLLLQPLLQDKKFPRMRIALISGQREADLREKFAALLNSAGVSTWTLSNLLPGEDRRLAIKHALGESHFILVLLSERSLNTVGEFQWQINAAFEANDELPEGGIGVIPCLLEPCELNGSLGRLRGVNLYEGVKAWAALVTSFAVEFARRKKYHDWGPAKTAANWTVPKVP